MCLLVVRIEQSCLLRKKRIFQGMMAMSGLFLSGSRAADDAVGGVCGLCGLVGADRNGW